MGPRWEQERQNRSKLMRDVELREAQEKEKLRQEAVVREMIKEVGGLVFAKQWKRCKCTES